MDLQSLFSGMNAVLGGAIVGVVMAIKQVPGMSTSHWGQRLTPLIPLALGAIGGLVGAVVVDPVTLANKVVAGLMVGGLAMVVFNITNKTLLGKGIDSPAVQDVKAAEGPHELTPATSIEVPVDHTHPVEPPKGE